jgi:hypothetical protein
VRPGVSILHALYVVTPLSMVGSELVNSQVSDDDVRPRERLT